MQLFHVIIVNYKSTDSLLRCLQGMKADNGQIEIPCTIYDNSCDTEISRVASVYPNCEIIRNPSNIGFALAVNKGIRNCKTPYMALVNPDTRFQRNVFIEICEYLENHQDVGVVGPKIMNDDGSIQESARAFPSILTGLFGRTSTISRILPKNRITRDNLLSHKAGKEPIDVDWVSGAYMIARRKAIEEVGLMDERFFMYWEDADWCRRMRERAWKVVYYPGVSVYHSTGHSSRTRPIRSILEFHKSAYRLYAKYAEGYQRVLKPFVFWALAMRFYVNAIKLMLYPRNNPK